MSRHYVITISRQFGTGGREIGKALGAALGVPVYDRELLEEAARTYCIPVSVMERNDETAPSRVLESFALSAPSLSMLTGAVDYSTIVTSDTTFAWQSATIRRLAKEGPCVIIGRCADHVLRSEVDEQDVVAFAGTASAVCAAILRFREGRLVDKREFLFHDTQDISALREEFLPRYYLEDNEFIPKSIAVDELPAGSGELARLLGETRGSKVRLYVPQRGDTARLVEMARTNAVERLARESGRYAREQKHLDELAALLGLKEPPRIIESYDISNWGDGTSVAGMVVFEDGKPKKAGYRRFKMNTVAGTDDYASMAETLARRAAEYEKGAKGQFGIKPDLLLIDGGRGQVSAVQAALAGTQLADVPMFGMVKDDKHRTRGLVSAAGGEIMLAMHRGVFTFVTSIQDETHRWANDYRRRMQKSRAYSSTLQSVPGVGPATSRALMAHFKTVSAVKEASEEQLAGAKGVSRAAARAVYAHFHPQPEQPSAET